MGQRVSETLVVLAAFFLICSNTVYVEGYGSVFFLDNQNRDFFRRQTVNVYDETYSMSLPEVGSAVSVLLGFAPSGTLTASSSSKLNRVLVPNPFERPRAVFMLEIRGVQEFLSVISSDSVFTSAVKVDVPPGFSKADVLLPDGGEVSVHLLNEVFRSGNIKVLGDKDVIDFASWLGGSYSMDAEMPLSGDVIVPLPDDTQLKLHMFQKEDRELVLSVMQLLHSIRNAIEIHEIYARSPRHPAELVSGLFEGTPRLRDQHGLKLFLFAFSKMFSSLQSAFKGQLAGVVLFNHGPSSSETHDTMLNIDPNHRGLFRVMTETDPPDNSTIATEVLMVRRTLAWLTGLILLIATLLGTYFLLNMPLSRDTLLYSNMKLD